MNEQIIFLAKEIDESHRNFRDRVEEYLSTLRQQSPFWERITTLVDSGSCFAVFVLLERAEVTITQKFDETVGQFKDRLAAEMANLSEPLVVGSGLTNEGIVTIRISFKKSQICKLVFLL